MVADFKKQFWISLVPTIPVVALAPMIWSLLGLEGRPKFTGDSFVQFASIVYFYAG